MTGGMLRGVSGGPRSAATPNRSRFSASRGNGSVGARYIPDSDGDGESELEVFGLGETAAGHVVVSTILIRSSDLSIDRHWQSEALVSPVVLRGDVDRDGQVTEEDVRQLLPLIGSDSRVRPLADIDRDGVISTTDVRLAIDRYGDTVERAKAEIDQRRTAALERETGADAITDAVSDGMGGVVQTVEDDDAFDRFINQTDDDLCLVLYWSCVRRSAG
jgi:hypothetical protein